MKQLTVNDLFCGAGGMGVGFKQAGFDIAGAWDFDKYAVQSYKHNVGDHVKQLSILDMTHEDMPNADVWTFGFPCQDLSLAGKQAGLFEGKRSGLFFEVMRLLDETIEHDVDKSPKIIMAENVKGLKPYLETLENEYKKRGYKMFYALYNSKYWGVPQNRERYFVCGVQESVVTDFVFPTQQELYIPRIFDITEKNVNEKYTLSDRLWGGHLRRKKEHREKGNGFGYMLYNENDTYTGTLSARYYKDGSEILLEQKGRNPRKLTPREAARLQGFPDSYEIVVSDSQAYKQFGNAVTVNVAQAIAERIKMFLLSL